MIEVKSSINVDDLNIAECKSCKFKMHTTDPVYVNGFVLCQNCAMTFKRKADCEKASKEFNEMQDHVLHERRTKPMSLQDIQNISCEEKLKQQKEKLKHFEMIKNISCKKCGAYNVSLDSSLQLCKSCCASKEEKNLGCKNCGQTVPLDIDTNLCVTCFHIAEKKENTSEAGDELPVGEMLQVKQNKYGPFRHHAYVTQQLKNALINCSDRKCQNLRAYQKEALEMICHKLGRIVNGDPNYIDSWKDIAGYAQLVVDILNGKDT